MIDEKYLRELSSDGMESFIDSIADDTYHSSSLDHWLELEELGFEGFLRKEFDDAYSSYEVECPVCNDQPLGCVVCDHSGYVDLMAPGMYAYLKREEAKAFSVLGVEFPKLAKVVNMAAYRLLTDNYNFEEEQRAVGAALREFCKATDNVGCWYGEDFVRKVYKVVRGVVGYIDNVACIGYQDYF